MGRTVGRLPPERLPDFQGRHCPRNADNAALGSRSEPGPDRKSPGPMPLTAHTGCWRLAKIEGCNGLWAHYGQADRCADNLATADGGMGCRRSRDLSRTRIRPSGWPSEVGRPRHWRYPTAPANVAFQVQRQYIKAPTEQLSLGPLRPKTQRSRNYNARRRPYCNQGTWQSAISKPYWPHAEARRNAFS